MSDEPKLNEYFAPDAWLSQSEIERLKAAKIIPQCPRCRGRARRNFPSAYGMRHSCCEFHSWEYKPLVLPSTHAARSMAHGAFDPIWQKRFMKRREAYVWLADQLGCDEAHAHMAGMPAVIAIRVVEICMHYMAGHVERDIKRRVEEDHHER